MLRNGSLSYFLNVCILTFPSSQMPDVMVFHCRVNLQGYQVVHMKHFIFCQSFLIALKVSTREDIVFFSFLRVNSKSGLKLTSMLSVERW